MPKETGMTDREMRIRRAAKRYAWVKNTNVVRILLGEPKVESVEKILAAMDAHLKAPASGAAGAIGKAGQ